jgi:hypothetical protein
MKPEFSEQILEKSSTIKFHENPSSGGRVYMRADRRADGRTDRKYEANSRFSQFCERASIAQHVVLVCQDAHLNGEVNIDPCRTLLQYRLLHLLTCDQQSLIKAI